MGQCLDCVGHKARKTLLGVPSAGPHGQVALERLGFHLYVNVNTALKAVNPPITFT